MGSQYKNLCDMMIYKEQEQIYSQQLAQVLQAPSQQILSQEPVIQEAPFES